MPNYSPRRIISTQTSSGKKETDIVISSKSTPSPFRNKQCQSSARKRPFQSSFRDDPCAETEDDGTLMSKVLASPTSSFGGHTNRDYDQASQILVNSSRKANHNLSGSKRRNIDMVPLDGDHDDHDIIARIQQSPKLNHSGGRNSDSSLEESNQMSNGSKMIEVDKCRTHMHWTDVS